MQDELAVAPTQVMLIAIPASASLECMVIVSVPLQRRLSHPYAHSDEEIQPRGGQFANFCKLGGTQGVTPWRSVVDGVDVDFDLVVVIPATAAAPTISTPISTSIAATAAAPTISTSIATTAPAPTTTVATAAAIATTG